MLESERQKTNYNVEDLHVAGSAKGVNAVLDQALQAYEKLPMLEVVLEKFVQQLSVALRNLTSEAVEVEVADFRSLRFGDYLKIMKHPASLVVFKAVEWENVGLLVLNSDLVSLFVDVLLGGKISYNHKNDATKLLTTIEQGLSKQISEVVFSELSTAFDQVSPTTFVFERLENNPSFVNVCRPADAVISLKISINIDSKGDMMDLIIPYKTIDPIKEQLQQVFFGDKFANNSLWEEKMLQAVHAIDLPLEAVIVNQLTPLHQVLNLKIGDTIHFEHKHDQDVLLRTANKPMFKAQIGKVEDKMAVTLTDYIEKSTH